MKRVKLIVGLVLMAASAAGVYAWETIGREAVLLDTVLVAAEDIPAGTTAEEKLFRSVSVSGDTLVKGAVSSETIQVVLGKKALKDIPQNAQIAGAYFAEEPLSREEGQSIFVLPGEWIAMESSSLRRGDSVSVYLSETLDYLGSYQVAFVRTREGAEVSDDETGNVDPEPLNRTGGTGTGYSVEIIASLSEFDRIAEYCLLQPEPVLLLVQEEAERG